MIEISSAYKSETNTERSATEKQIQNYTWKYTHIYSNVKKQVQSDSTNTLKIKAV